MFFQSEYGQIFRIPIKYSFPLNMLDKSTHMKKNDESDRLANIV
jgi:hypothetical protein